MNEAWTDGGGEITRRHVLRVAVRNGLVMVCALLGENAAAAGPAWTPVGNATGFKVGVPKRVTLKSGQTVFIVRQRNNRWLAVSARCTHKGVEVRWDAGRNRFVCPAHQATFGIDGKNPTGPARSPLAALPAQVAGKSVQVDVSKAGAPAGGTGKGGKRGAREHDDDERHGGKERKQRRERDDDDD